MGKLLDTVGAISPIIQAGAEIAGIGAQQGGNFKQRKWAGMQNDKAFAYNTDMWNKSNAYNSPMAQMERLKAAGLNPNQIYGSGSETGGITSPMSAPSQQSYVNPQQGINLGESVGRILGTVNTSAQRDLLQIQTAKVAQEIAESQVRTAKMGGVDTEKAMTDIAESAERTKNYGVQRGNLDATTERTKVGTEMDLQTLRQAYRLQDISADAAAEALRGQQLSNESKVIENSNLDARQKQAMREAEGRIKEAYSRMGIQGVEKQLKDEQLKMRKMGVEVTDPLWARVAQKVVGGQLKDVKEEFSEQRKSNKQKGKSDLNPMQPR